MSGVEDGAGAARRRRAEEWIARSHAEAAGERLDVVVRLLEKIVHIHVEHVDTGKAGTVRMLKIETRCPVVAEIVLDQ